MQRLYTLQWNIVGFLLLSLSQVNYAQNMFDTQSYMSSKNQASSLPTPSTMSNDAFQAKVKSQNTAIQNSLTQEVKNETATLNTPQKNMQQTMQPNQTTDNTGFSTQATIAPGQTQGAGEENTETEAPTNYTVPPPPPTNQQTPTQNTPPSNTQGGWQIQY